VKVYNHMKKTRADDFEFVFVSSDRDETAFNEYFAEMPWLALPFKNRSGKSQLSDLFDVRGIPSLVTLNSEFEVINKTARGRAGGDLTGAEFPWFPKPVNEVNDVTDGLNDEVCVVVLLDGASDADKKQRKADLEAVAKKYYAKKGAPEYRFFFEEAKGQVSTQIRSLTGAAGAKTIILDLGDGGSFYNCTAEGDVEGQLTALKANKLKKMQVKQ